MNSINLATLLMTTLRNGGSDPYTSIPAQTLGAELLVNGDFSDGTGTFPNGFTYALGTSGGDPGISQTAANGGAGAGSAKFTQSAAVENTPALTQTIFTVGDYYEAAAEMTQRTSGTLTYRIGGNAQTLSAVGTAVLMARADSTGYLVRANNNPSSWVGDNLSAKKITPSTQKTAPSANQKITGLYTLPGSPRKGEAVWLMPRISNFSSGNYWVAVLTYTGSQWNINLYSVAAHTRTSRISATNIGTTNGIYVNMNGDSVSLYTTANGGSSWTQQGSTITNATYNIAVDYNMMATSLVTMTQLKYEPAA